MNTVEPTAGENNVVGLTSRSDRAAVLPDLKNAPNQLWGSPGFLLSKAADQVETQFAVALRPHEISPREYGVLASITDQGPQSQQQIGERLGIDRTTMVNIIDDLEKRDLVIRVRDKQDRRRYAITLSAQGAALLTEVLPEVDAAAHDRYMAVLDQGERDALLDMLRRLIAANSQ